MKDNGTGTGSKSVPLQARQRGPKVEDINMAGQPAQLVGDKVVMSKESAQELIDQLNVPQQIAGAYSDKISGEAARAAGQKAVQMAKPGIFNIKNPVTKGTWMNLATMLILGTITGLIFWIAALYDRLGQNWWPLAMLVLFIDGGLLYITAKHREMGLYAIAMTKEAEKDDDS